MKKIIFVIIVLLIIGFAWSFFTEVMGPKEKIDQSKTFQSNEVSVLKVNTDVGNIRFHESDKEEISVHLYGEVPKDFKSIIKQSGDAVIVNGFKDKSRFLFLPSFSINGDIEFTIEIELPKNTLDLVQANADVADIEAGTVHAKKLVLTNDVGDIKIEGFSGDVMSIETNVGEVVVHEATGRIDIQTNTGEINLTLSEVTDDLNVKTDVGDITITVVDKTEKVGLDLDTDVGEININGGPFLTGTNSDGPTIKGRTDVGEITINSK